MEYCLTTKTVALPVRRARGNDGWLAAGEGAEGFEDFLFAWAGGRGFGWGVVDGGFFGEVVGEAEERGDVEVVVVGVDGGFAVGEDIEVACGDGEGADDVAGASGAYLAEEFERDDGMEEGLDTRAILEGDVDVFDFEVGLGTAVGAATGGGLGAVLFAIAGIVVATEGAALDGVEAAAGAGAFEDVVAAGAGVIAGAGRAVSVQAFPAGIVHGDDAERAEIVSRGSKP
jgi:hypothetical protein